MLEVVKVTNYSELWDAQPVWYSPSATWKISLHGMDYSLGIHCFRPTWPDQIVVVLAMWTKFLEQYDYCIVFNCTFSFHTTNLLVCLCHSNSWIRKPCTSVWEFFLDHTRDKAMHYMQAHQLPRYYRPRWLSSMVWNSSITWYTRLKLQYRHWKTFDSPKWNI